VTDAQKFQCMIKKYRDVYDHYEAFAKKIGANRSTVNKWEIGQGDKFQKTSRAKICHGFNLKYEVWEEPILTEQDFMRRLDSFLEEKEPEDHWENKEKVFFEDIIHMSPKEEDLLRELSKQDPVSTPGNIEQFSPDFMLALAKLLQTNNQTEDALRVLNMLLGLKSVYKAKHYNTIQHLKAVLLSSEKIKEWDSALDILNLLYFSARYHLENPEVLTLIASNYKRKALYSANGKLNPPDSQYVDMDLLGKALASYREAYDLKTNDQDKYYDAINIAYLIGILNALEEEDAEQDFKTEVKALRKELHDNGWRVNEDNWWEVATEVEFLVLAGKVNDAIAKVEEYLEWNEKNLQKFDIETTIRQMKLYVHFTDDAHAKAFLSQLEENWEAIQKYR